MWQDLKMSRSQYEAEKVLSDSILNEEQMLNL